MTQKQFILKKCPVLSYIINLMVMYDDLFLNDSEDHAAVGVVF